MKNNLLNRITELKKTGNFAGKEMNPKNDDSPVFGPLSMPTYFNNRPVSAISHDIVVTRKAQKQVSPKFVMTTVEVIDDVDVVSKMTRMDLSSVGFMSARLVSFENQPIAKAIIVQLTSGQIKPLYFPVEDSNVGVYTNAKFELSYVTDGRVCLSDEGELAWISTNQEALESYIESVQRKEIKSFTKILSEKQWKINDTIEAKDNYTKVIKALSWIGSCEYVDFPRYKDDFPVNVVWGDTEDWDWLEIIKFNPKVAGQIRVSSLSQNGVNASCGRLLPNSKIGMAKPFFGKKAKFDISANQLIKNFKYHKPNHKRVLVVPAEITVPGTNTPMNGLGNCLASKGAYDEYVSQLTYEKSKECKANYVAHKIFIQAGDKEVVRVKGATSIINMKATKENGDIEDKIVVLPPREYSSKGVLEEDFDKIHFLFQFSDNKAIKVKLKVEVNGEVMLIDTVGIYCDIYEDAYHSAVYSLKIKPQNLFYYGTFLEMYRKNGFANMTYSVTCMLDHHKISQAMNFVGIEKGSYSQVPLDMFLSKTK